MKLKTKFMRNKFLAKVWKLFRLIFIGGLIFAIVKYAKVNIFQTGQISTTPNSIISQKASSQSLHAVLLGSEYSQEEYSQYFSLYSSLQGIIRWIKKLLGFSDYITYPRRPSWDNSEGLGKWIIERYEEVIDFLKEHPWTIIIILIAIFSIAFLMDSYKNSTSNIEKVTLSHDARQGIAKGLKISVKFSVVAVAGSNCQIGALFYKDSNPIYCSDPKYSTHNHQLATIQQFNPRQTNSTYENFELFLPYSCLRKTKLPKGSHNLSFDIILWDSRRNQLASEKYSFHYQK
jgi:hypothetical protein